MTTPHMNALAQPMRLGRITAKNRIWVSPLWTRTASVEGEAVERVIEHYRARAKGGAGLITLEATAVDANHVWHEPQLRIDDNKYITGLSRVVDAAHAYNTPIICQLHHAGMYGTNPVSPSGVACHSIGLQQLIQPAVLSVAEVEAICRKFIDAAERAMLAGFDGVELHGGTGYLLEQFFSPHNNKRLDKYGGNLNNRMRLAVEIVRGIRKRLGPDFVVGYTGIDSDLIEGGIVREDNMAFGQTLAREGLTYFDLQTSGVYETFHLADAPGGTARQVRGQFEMAGLYNKALPIPVVTRGSAENNPKVWNDAVKKGHVEAVRLGRMMLCDPDVFNKVLKNRPEDIRACIRCGNCHVSGVIKPTRLSCTVNPGMGRGEPQVQPSPVKKKVVVVGGGPAGLESARVCALRGHAVTLLEKTDRLGGNQYIGSLPIAKESLMEYVNWAGNQCKKLGVDVKMKTEASKATVSAMNPDAVFIATGSTPVKPPIPGIDGKNVLLAEQVLTGEAKVGDNVIILGGGEVGLETADLLLEKDLAKTVTVVEMLPMVGQDMSPMDMGSLFANVFPQFMAQGRLRLCTGTKAVSISPDGVEALDGGGMRKFAADTVVIALGYAPNNALYNDMFGEDIELYVLGDAARPGKILTAIHQANEIAKGV